MVRQLFIWRINAKKITTRLGCLSVGERYQDFIGDPFMVPVWDCCLCKTAPEVLRKKNGKWLYRCSGCGKEVVGKEKWRGILRWNRKNCFGKTLAEIPFPALQQESSPQSVIDYLDEYFSLKKKEVGLTRQIAQLTGKRPPGKVYQKRVEAFYEWAALAKDIVRYSDRMYFGKGMQVQKPELDC